MNNPPLISVIIPVFNREKLILETLNSVLFQSYRNWECIVIDDKSTDDSYSKALDYSLRDKRIRVFKNNLVQGASSCREFGKRISNGQLLIFLDSDDVIAPWSLETRAQFFMRNPNLDVLLSNGIQFNSKNRELFGYSTIYADQNVLDSFLQMQIVFQTTTPTWKKSFLIKHNICWDPEIIQLDDVDFALQCFICNPNYSWGSIIPDYFLRKEDDPNALTSNDKIVQKVLSNLNTYDKWISTTKYGLKLRQFYPDYMLRKLEFLLSKQELDVLVNCHRNVLVKHLGKNSILYLKLYNKTRDIKYLRGIVFRFRPVISNIKRIRLKESKNEETILSTKKELLQKLIEYDSKHILRLIQKNDFQYS